MKLQIESKKSLHTLYFGYSIVHNSQLTEGYTNRCADDQWIVFLDIEDGWKLSDVMGNIKYIEEQTGYQFDFILQTNKGFHAIGIEKVDFHKLQRIYNLSIADPIFIQVPFKTYLHSSTLRIGKKDGTYPKFISQIRRRYDPKVRLSKAHFKMLRKCFPKIKIPIGRFDDNEELNIVSYWTKPEKIGGMKW